MGTDASPRGYGGTLGGQCIAGRFPRTWSGLSIEALECYPVLALVGTFASSLQNKEVILECDNLPLVHCLNKLSSKNQQVMRLMRPLVLLLLEHNITLKAVHLSSKDNWLCDTLSRQQVTGDWLVRHGKAPLTAIPQGLRPESLGIGSTH